MNAERRHHTAPIVLDEVRSAGDELRLKGYAAVFNSPSEDMGFREVIMPGAFRDALQSKTTDLTLLWQHRTDQPLARQSAGNLRVWEDARGLAFEATLPKTQLAKDALTLTRAGVVKNMSFAFSMADGRERKQMKDGELWRYVESVGALYEISLVTEPAYEATSVEPRSAAALEAIRRHARPRDAGPYGEHSRFSYFRDLATVTFDDNAKSVRSDLPGGVSMIHNGLGTSPIHGDVVEARARLAEVDDRALTSVAFDFLTQTASGGPGFLGDLFAAAARTKAALTSVLARADLPKDLNIKVPRLTSGASVGYQLEGQPISSTDPATALLDAPVATIAGYVDAAQQDLDQTPGHLLDRAIAADLGAAYVAALEQEVITGDGTAQHLLGLLTLAGVAASTYTDATPTPVELLAAVGSTYAATALAYGGPIDTIVMHTRRRAWVDTKIGVPFRWPANVIESNGIPTNLGAGTEDAMLFLARDETFLLTSDVHFDVLAEIGSGTLTVRYRAYGYAALIGRLLASIGKLTGTGLSAPVF